LRLARLQGDTFRHIRLHAQTHFMRYALVDFLGRPGSSILDFPVCLFKRSPSGFPDLMRLFCRQIAGYRVMGDTIIKDPFSGVYCGRGGSRVPITGELTRRESGFIGGSGCLRTLTRGTSSP
jgi:hypothetical protein